MSAAPTPVDSSLSNESTLAAAVMSNLGLDPSTSNLPSRLVPGENYRVVCPVCQGGSTREESLSLTVLESGRAAIYNCFRGTCGATGSVRLRGGRTELMGTDSVPPDSVVKGPPVRPEESHLGPLPTEALAFFAGRGISAQTLERCGVVADYGPEAMGVICPVTREHEVPIAFTYRRRGELINIKYRSTDRKCFWQVKGAEKILYGLDDIMGGSGSGSIDTTDTVIIVEGEVDKLSLYEAGLTAVVSVPDGAPAKLKEGQVDPSRDRKFEYLWNCEAELGDKTKIIIGTDNDEPGSVLAEELARRLGRERCYVVEWPMGGPSVRRVQQAEAKVAEAEAHVTTLLQKLEDKGNRRDREERAGDDASGVLDQDQDLVEAIADARDVLAERQRLLMEANSEDAGPRKDANHVLTLDGPERLMELFAEPRPYPIRGLFDFDDFADDIFKYYDRGEENGVSTGWASLDGVYQICPGELTIVTGVPNSGKSEWIDALLVNLALTQGWTFAFCSMEKTVRHHGRHLLEKYIGKPFFDRVVYAAEGSHRMSEAEMGEGLAWINQHFALIRYEDDSLPSIDWVLEKARSAVMRHGIRGLVIDPYNELDHTRGTALSETEYVSQMLTKMKRFAQHYDVHVWFVAHPRILRDWKGTPPNLYDIAGSAHFVNKADNGVVVHRVRDPGGDARRNRQVDVLVQKVRNKAAGTIGEATLVYDVANGRYLDPSGRQVALPNASLRVLNGMAEVIAERRSRAGGAPGAGAAWAARGTGLGVNPGPEGQRRGGDVVDRLAKPATTDGGFSRTGNEKRGGGNGPPSPVAVRYVDGRASVAPPLSQGGEWVVPDSDLPGEADLNRRDTPRG